MPCQRWIRTRTRQLCGAGLQPCTSGRVRRRSTSAAAASPARWPLTTALSIVAGRPVSIQSPARNRPLTGVTVCGRRGCPGASENVARFSLTTTARITAAARAAASASALLRRRGRSAPGCSWRRCFGAAGDQRQMRRRLAERLPLVEDPLHRAPREPDERHRGHRAIEPQVDCHNRRRRSLPWPLQRLRHAAGASIERPLQCVPRNGTHDRAASIRSPRTSTCDRALAGAYDACDRAGPALRCRARRAIAPPAWHTRHRAGPAAARSPHPGAIRRTSAPARGRTAQPPRHPSAGSAPLPPAVPRAARRAALVCRCRRSHAPTVSCCC